MGVNGAIAAPDWTCRCCRPAADSALRPHRQWRVSEKFCAARAAKRCAPIGAGRIDSHRFDRVASVDASRCWPTVLVPRLRDAQHVKRAGARQLHTDASPSLMCAVRRAYSPTHTYGGRAAPLSTKRPVRRRLHELATDGGEDTSCDLERLELGGGLRRRTGGVAVDEHTAEALVRALMLGVDWRAYRNAAPLRGPRAAAALLLPQQKPSADNG